MKKRTSIFWVASLVVFVVINGLIWQKQHLLRTGEVMLLQLAPRDPRSLMQGDYMTLRYALMEESGQAAAEEATQTTATKGALVVKLDDHQVARFVRVHKGENLAPDERLLRYRLREGEFSVGAESFFFQEGQAELYARARYGELRVSSTGESLLVGLRDENFDLLRGDTDGDSRFSLPPIKDLPDFSQTPTQISVARS